ncbi:MAG: hypothetical protein K2X86_09580 [Cytophagaceae bacterium]|nr:hypothetical protein [Cytophagaceae bacterium]
MELTEKQAEKIEKKAEKGKDIELYQFSLDDLVIRSDGGMVLTGEQYFVRVHTYTTSNPNGGMSTTTVYKYHYNDIIVININPEGNIQWATKIPKTQITSNDGGFFSSYSMAVASDKLYFVFNDNPKNLVSSVEGKTFNFVPYKESHVVCVQIDNNGKIEKKSLFSSKDVDIITRPKVCEQINDNCLLIFGQRKSTQRFALMTF